MSPTSYQAAPPRVIDITRLAVVLQPRSLANSSTTPNGRNSCAAPRTIDAPDDHLGEAKGFGRFMLGALLNGRTDELIDLAKGNLLR